MGDSSRRVLVCALFRAVIAAATLASFLGNAASSQAATTTTFGATADAHVLQQSPSSNYGAAGTLQVAGGTGVGQATYMRFSVANLPGAVVSATVRLWNVNPTVDGPAIYPTSGSWTESGLTWSNRPAATGSATADVGAVAQSGWASFDVTRLVSGNGTVNLVLTQPSADGDWYISRDSSQTAYRPQLVITTSTAQSATPACTLYASPSGSAANSGTSATAPTTLDAASSRTVAGSTVCLQAGTYSRSSPLYITHAGTSSAWITYTSYGGTALIKWTGGASNIFQVSNGGKYIQIQNLQFDGANANTQAIFCSSSTHIRAIGNRVSNSGAGGISSVGCDYVTVDHNLIYHTGYGKGWSSGVSLNTNVWSDSYDGFHNFVTNNIISGSDDNSSYHSDGNGIIMDRGTSTPPVLIANNLVHENYARCIHSFYVSNVWIVNNTCYKNALRDNASSGPTLTGEFTVYAATNVHLINDVVNAWTGTYTYKVESGSTITMQHDVAYGGRGPLLPTSVTADSRQYRVAAPLFVAPVSVNPYAAGQYTTAVAPWNVGNDFTLQSGSTLVGAGIDPRTATGLNTDQRNDMTPYVTHDLAGNPRPLSGSWDVGAYER